MIDPVSRQQLSQDIRRLVTGRTTNDGFDDVYFNRYAAPMDLGVQCIANFGYSLYSSDTLWPYQLTGRHSVDKATRRVAARCVLFLRSGREYGWPEPPGTLVEDLLYGLAMSAGIPGGIAVLICSVPPLVLQLRDVEFLWPVAALGALLLALSLWNVARQMSRRTVYKSPVWQRWRESGDFDVWPFLRREEFYQARRTNVLLSL